MPAVTVYSREGCHLCDEAVALLKKYGREVTVIDVDKHPDLRAQFDQCVPVVMIDAKIRFRGRVNEVLLKRYLSANP